MSKLEDIIFEVLVDHGLNTDQKGGTLADYFTELLENFIEDNGCEFDHHGGCQSHGYLSLEPGEICPQQKLKELLAPNQPTKAN